MRQKLEKQSNRSGDTLIEVMLSISIFAMVSLLTINMMNGGINTAQRTLEAEMARNEIDGQADALRYIHNNYVAERNMDNSQFRKAWNTITQKAMRPSQVKDGEDNNVFFDINNMESCEEPYEGGNHLENFRAFVVNPRLLIPNNFSDEGEHNADIEYMGIPYDKLLNKMLVYANDQDGKNAFSSPSLYPRIIYKEMDSSATDDELEDRSLYDYGAIYNDIAKAEGIWINAVGNDNQFSYRSDYFDFYIRTCWHSAGTRVPSTITTVVRLYNPEVME